MKESDIQRTILDGLTAKRIFAFRLNTGGTKIAGGYFRAHTLGKGAADILAFPKIYVERVLQAVEWPVWLEVKTATGKQSSEQVSFAEKVESHGQFYFVVTCWEDVEIMLEDLSI